jgi:membrane-associated protease RseP (regulator of RpoE activity)
MTEPGELAQWFFSPVAEGDVPSGFDLYGSETEIEVLEADAHRRFRYSETGGPVPKVDGYAEVTVTFEDEGSGTRITITRSGFGEGPEWDAALESVSRGLDESIADCVLYVETGVSFPRHPRQRGGTGIVGRDSPGGLLVHAVEPDSFGSRLELDAGDVLVELGGAPVFGNRELLYFMREHQPGERVDATWVRNGHLCRASAELDAWRPLAWRGLSTGPSGLGPANVHR